MGRNWAPGARGAHIKRFQHEPGYRVPGAARTQSLTPKLAPPGPNSVAYAASGTRPETQAPVAQLDRASGFEPEGREFESLRARHLTFPTVAAVPHCLVEDCDVMPDGPPRRG
jgi:hypothetical protein